MSYSTRWRPAEVPHEFTSGLRLRWPTERRFHTSISAPPNCNVSFHLCVCVCVFFFSLFSDFRPPLSPSRPPVLHACPQPFCETCRPAAQHGPARTLIEMPWFGLTIANVPGHACFSQQQPEVSQQQQLKRAVTTDSCAFAQGLRGPRQALLSSVDIHPVLSPPGQRKQQTS